MRAMLGLFLSMVAMVTIEPFSVMAAPEAWSSKAVWDVSMVVLCKHLNEQALDCVLISNLFIFVYIL